LADLRIEKQKVSKFWNTVRGVIRLLFRLTVIFVVIVVGFNIWLVYKHK